MSPRPQTISNDEVLDGTARMIGRLGIMRLTLSDVATELRITPGTLVHRFGSKRELLLSLMRRSVEKSAGRIAALRSAAGSRSPYGMLLALGDRAAGHVETPAALANNLTFFQVNLGDPQFHRLMRARARGLRREIRTLTRQAVAAGELRPCNTEQLARTLQATINGSLLQWAIEQQGSLTSWIRSNLETVLRPFARRRARPIK